MENENGKLYEIFPFLAQLNQGQQHEFHLSATQICLSPGSFICREGDRCGVIPLLLSGVARVYKTNESGREITLYRIDPGESCILTTSCILSDVPFPAFAVAETEIKACVVPAETFYNWVNQIPQWRDFVFHLLTLRLSSVIEIVEEVTFQKLDVRLASYILELSEKGLLRTTHEKIATDLGSSREVISRILKEFERGGMITLSRGMLVLNDGARLREVGHHNRSF